MSFMTLGMDYASSVNNSGTPSAVQEVRETPLKHYWAGFYDAGLY